MILTILLFVVLLILFLWENYQHQKNLKKVPVRILVNGTRGKTTVARLVCASLNAKGIRTLGRTTGSEAEIIYPDGHVEPFVRKRKATILEMKAIFRLANKEQVDALVIECMALTPENQRTMGRNLVRPTHVLITNSYIDHVAEMGPSLEETIYALSQSVGKDSKLYVTEDYYGKTPCASLTVTKTPLPVTFDTPIKIHPSGYALSLALLKDFGVGVEDIEKGVKTILPDIGLHEMFQGKNGAHLIPTFSVNDLHCMDLTVKDALSQYPGKRILLVYNNRQDREYRIQLMDQVIRRNREHIAGVIVIGDYRWKVKTWFRRLKVSVRSADTESLYREIEEKSDEYVYVGLGNIKGRGEGLLSYFLKEEKHA
ncbi:MAG: hypothetical protein KBS81_06630 [Spirochaetales bacterium]|nr:hypothetical protein [Candidatus Physcosoma equi]